MLRNIPNKYMQSSLLDEINDMGFEGTYNFFYLPMDVHNKTNVGYAFINFTSSFDLQRFIDKFSGRTFERNPSQKIASVSPAHVQGLENNVRQLARKAVAQFKDPEYQPIVLRNGQKISFSEALKDIKRGTALEDW